MGVWPGAAARSRSRLFDALSQVTGLRFEPLDDLPAAPDGPGALVLLAPPDDGQAVSELPMLVFEGRPGISQVGPITFADSTSADPRLRAQTLLGNWSPCDGAAAAGSEVIATAGREPIWLRRRSEPLLDAVCVDLPELGEYEQLRHRLRPGHCLGMIALLHFVRSVFPQEWSPPPTRACFVIDDPNTRKPTYGHIDYPGLVRHADEFNYHVTFAHIPLDFRKFDPDTVALFRSHGDRLSLAIHGNDHIRHELLTPRTSEEADQVLAQALRRTSRFEARTGLPVGKVMVPPHGRCSELVLREMSRVGLESITLALPRIPQAVAAGFDPAEVSDTAMPVIVRRKIYQHDQAILRAFLDQPVVLYGHETDFRAGLEFLERAANVLNRMDDVSWHGLEGISRSNFVTRRSGDELEVKAFSRRVHIAVEPGVNTVIVKPLVEKVDGEESELSNEPGERVAVPDSAGARIVIKPSDGPTVLDISFESRDRIDPDSLADPRFRPSPVLRRTATEIRDRSHPLRRRVSRRFS